jgi:hypothetical protein
LCVESDGKLVQIRSIFIPFLSLFVKTSSS